MQLKTRRPPNSVTSCRHGARLVDRSIAQQSTSAPQERTLARPVMKRRPGTEARPNEATSLRNIAAASRRRADGAGSAADATWEEAAEQVPGAVMGQTDVRT